MNPSSTSFKRSEPIWVTCGCCGAGGGGFVGGGKFCWHGNHLWPRLFGSCLIGCHSDIICRLLGGGALWGRFCWYHHGLCGSQYSRLCGCHNSFKKKKPKKQMTYFVKVPSPNHKLYIKTSLFFYYSDSIRVCKCDNSWQIRRVYNLPEAWSANLTIQGRLTVLL